MASNLTYHFGEVLGMNTLLPLPPVAAWSSPALSHGPVAIDSLVMVISGFNGEVKLANDLD
jgi:hypothetical protein